jgi:hypothetical protein
MRLGIHYPSRIEFGRSRHAPFVKHFIDSGTAEYIKKLAGSGNLWLQ